MKNRKWLCAAQVNRGTVSRLELLADLLASELYVDVAD